MKYTIKGSDYGVAAGDFQIDVAEIVDGIPVYEADGTSNFPRNDAEKQMLSEIIAGFQTQQNLIQNNTTADGGTEAMTAEEERALKLKQFEEMRIKDPIRADLNLLETAAEGSAYQYAGDISEQLGNSIPGVGGSMLDFSPEKLLKISSKNLSNTQFLVSYLFQLYLSAHYFLYISKWSH